VREELDERLKNETQKILGTITSFSKKILDEQKTVSVKVDSVLGKVVSIRIALTELNRLLKSMTRVHPIKPKGQPVLIYFDSQKMKTKLNVRNAVIGRNEKGWDLEARFTNGNVFPLGLIDPTVSRKHAKITLKNGIVFLEDLGSKNGTFINGRKIQPFIPHILNDGDEITIGLNTKIQLRYTQEDCRP
jgi:hypothetical protein